ncbi:MAG: hypothetical protein JNK26_00635 [Candidatus Doudnabacteria bacterium]|nr:hypothetical protein [Candidatus Doudnabacteria bacterium]
MSLAIAEASIHVVEDVETRLKDIYVHIQTSAQPWERLIESIRFLCREIPVLETYFQFNTTWQKQITYALQHGLALASIQKLEDRKEIRSLRDAKTLLELLLTYCESTLQDSERKTELIKLTQRALDIIIHGYVTAEV